MPAGKGSGDYRGIEVLWDDISLVVAKGIARTGKTISYNFNMDIICVELHFADGGMISIDTHIPALKISHFRDIMNSSKQGGGMMAVSYKKLLHMLIDKDMSIAELQRQAGYSANISTRLRNDTYISLESVEKICRVLNCKMDEIIEFIPEDGGANSG